MIRLHPDQLFGGVNKDPRSHQERLHLGMDAGANVFEEGLGRAENLDPMGHPAAVQLPVGHEGDLPYGPSQAASRVGTAMRVPQTLGEEPVTTGPPRKVRNVSHGRAAWSSSQTE